MTSERIRLSGGDGRWSYSVEPCIDLDDTWVWTLYVDEEEYRYDYVGTEQEGHGEAKAAYRSELEELLPDL